MTYIGAAGKSVIDYIIEIEKKKIRKLEIKEEISLDHLMLQIELDVESKELNAEEKDKEVIIWNEDKNTGIAWKNREERKRWLLTEHGRSKPARDKLVSI